MIMTPDTFHDLVEDWIAPFAPRTQYDYRLTLHSFYRALHNERLDFDSNEKRLIDVVEKWAETLTRQDKIGEDAALNHQKQRKGKVRRFSNFAHEQGYAISDALLNLM